MRKICLVGGIETIELAMTAVSDAVTYIGVVLARLQTA
jgi:hypothetical protein